MSDDVLSVVPTESWWRPDEAAAERAEDVVRRLAPIPDDDFVEPEFETTRSEFVQVVDCGGNLLRISCPHCAGELDLEWFRDLGDDAELAAVGQALGHPVTQVRAHI